VRDLSAALLLGLGACLAWAVHAADESVLDVQALDSSVPDPSIAAVTGGTLDARFGPFSYRDARRRGGPFWLRLQARDAVTPPGIPVVIVHKGRLYAGSGVWNWDKAIKGISGPTHVYCYEGDKQWRDCGRFGSGFRVFSMASFKGDLYTGDDTGKCYRYDGDEKHHPDRYADQREETLELLDADLLEG
jgi:hypothetical protein